MCTALVRIDPHGRWPLLVAFVRDEDRGRPTDPPAFWWTQQPTLLGGRDARAGGTWLAVDVGGFPSGASGVAFVQNRIGPDVVEPLVAAPPSRGMLPLLALSDDHFDVADLRDLDRHHPFHLVRAMVREEAVEVDWWQWSGTDLVRIGLSPGMHLVASRGLDLPGERRRRADQLASFARAGTPEPEPGLPPARAWGPWLDLLDARDVEPGDLGGLAVRSIPDRPGFGTVGATLVAVATDGRVRYDINPSPRLEPAAWVPVDTVPGAVPAQGQA